MFHIKKNQTKTVSDFQNWDWNEIKKISFDEPHWKPDFQFHLCVKSKLKSFKFTS
jgi:hypothetical protein